MRSSRRSSRTNRRMPTRPSARTTTSDEQPEEVGEPLEDASPLLRGHRGAAGEERRVVAGRELLRVSEDPLERGPFPECARASVVERSSGHGGHAVDPAEDVVVRRREAGYLEGRRDEDGAVQADARGLLQRPSEAADPIAAVALAGDEHRRAPAPVLREPAAHELAERLEVALVAEVLLGIGGVVGLCAVLAVALLVGLDRAAEAGPDRIDEDEIREREPPGSSSTSCAGSSGSVPSAGNATRFGRPRPCAGTPTRRPARR